MLTERYFVQEDGRRSFININIHIHSYIIYIRVMKLKFLIHTFKKIVV